MSTIEKSKEKLQKYPHVRYKTDKRALSVPPSNPNGFTVMLAVSGNGYTVSFNGWHEEFEDEDEALIALHVACPTQRD